MENELLTQRSSRGGCGIPAGLVVTYCPRGCPRTKAVSCSVHLGCANVSCDQHMSHCYGHSLLSEPSHTLPPSALTWAE